jgi:hypothetical protein
MMVVACKLVAVLPVASFDNIADLHPEQVVGLQPPEFELHHSTP